MRGGLEKTQPKRLLGFFQGLLRRLLLGLVYFYRFGISPYTAPSCRFEPSCSAYAEEALHKHGALRGSLLSIYRILRCNPFSKGGFDPVPPSDGEGRR